MAAHSDQYLSLARARAMQALQAALNEADSLRVRVSISIVDVSGELLHMDSAPQLSREMRGARLLLR